MRGLLLVLILGGCRAIFGIGTPGLASGGGGAGMGGNGTCVGSLLGSGASSDGGGGGGGGGLGVVYVRGTFTLGAGAKVSPTADVH